MTKLTEHRFEDRQLLQDSLAFDTMDRLKLAVAQTGVASMILSGGTSPGALYRDLSEQDMPWDQVIFSLSDERWIDAEHVDSNAHMVKRRLLQKQAAKAEFVPLKTSANNVNDGLAQAQENFNKMPPKHTVTLLGMGDDGHTASLFPTAENLTDMLDISKPDLLAAVPMHGNGVDRISMTLTALLQSDVINILFFGTDKWDVYKRAKAEKTPALPVSYLLHQDRVPVHIYWAK